MGEENNRPAQITRAGFGIENEVSPTIWDDYIGKPVLVHSGGYSVAGVLKRYDPEFDCLKFRPSVVPYGSCFRWNEGDETTLTLLPSAPIRIFSQSMEDLKRTILDHNAEQDLEKRAKRKSAGLKVEDIPRLILPWNYDAD